jgi:hypothetical protein
MERSGQPLRVERAAASAEEAFALAVAALGELLPPVDGSGRPQRLPVLLAPGSPSELLHGFVADLLLLAQTEGFRPQRLERLQLRDGLRAAVSGQVFTERTTAPVCRSAVLEPAGGRWLMTIIVERSPQERREAPSTRTGG